MREMVTKIQLSIIGEILNFMCFIIQTPIIWTYKTVYIDNLFLVSKNMYIDIYWELNFMALGLL